METNLTSELIARPLSFAEAPAAVDLFNAYSLKVMGIQMDTVESVVAWWKTPGINLETDTCLLLTPEGRLAGFGEVTDLMANHLKLNGWGCVHPDFWGGGLGSRLVDWMVERARLSLPKAPADARVVFQNGIDSRDASARRLFEQKGFHLARSYWMMTIELENEPPAPLPPPGITIRPMLLGKEERATAAAVRESFKDLWGYVEDSFESYFARFQHNLQTNPLIDPALYFVATAGEEIVGISLCWKGMDEDPDMGWVATLGVLRPWRKAGLGLALLRHSFAELYRRGKKRVGLGVDATSLTGATRLYEKAGMHVTRQMDTFEIELRPGRDLATHALAD